MAMMCAMSKSRTGAFFLAGALLAACGPKETGRAESDAVVQDVAAADRGAAWPLLLRHCLSAAACDPMSNFGTGAGEASGVSGSVTWFFENNDQADEGAVDPGARAEINLFGMRAVGGPAGRPLVVDELPDNLGGARARRTTLSIKYRMASGVLEPVSFQFVSPHITQVAGGIANARLEIMGASGQLLQLEVQGAAAPKTPVNGRRKPPEAMIFEAARNLPDAPLSSLLTAITRGDTLSIRLAAADGRSLLKDVIYTDGFGDALRRAAEAGADPEITKPVAERCAHFSDEDDAFWKAATVTAALDVCDPRLPEQRR